MADYIIRSFEPGDRERVNNFFDRLGPEGKGFFNRGDGNRIGAMQYFDGNSGEVNCRRFMAVTDDGVMDGYVFLWAMDKKIPWLGLAISETAKGHGLGRRLLEYAKSYCNELGKGGILLTTHVANLRGQQLYENVGFERLGANNCYTEVQYLYTFPEDK
jgi:Acetyltransferases